MSSSRELVASFRLIKSVALSLLRRLSCDMSFCKLDTIELMPRSWVEIESNDWIGGADDRVGELEIFNSGGSMIWGGIVMVCRAIMVADGGVFSPRMALWLGRIEEVSLISNRVDGVGVPCRDGFISGSFPKSLLKYSLSRSRAGVPLRLVCLSGDRSGERSGERCVSR